MKLKPIFTLAIAPLCAVALLACNPGGGESQDGKVQVTFKNYDGTVLQSDRIEKGLDTSYKQEEIPSKPAQGNELYNKFVGWDKEMTNIKQDTVFNAVYKTIEKDRYVDRDHDGIPEGVDTNDDPTKKGNYFEVSAKSMVHIDQNITIDFSKFLDESASTKYDNEIAKLGLFLSNPKIDFKDGLFTDKAYGGRVNAMYARLGCDEWHHFDFKNNNYKYDSDDTTSGVYAHKYLFDDNGKIAKDLIIIAFEGTNGKKRWSSNFDVGFNGPEYFDKTGGDTNHPEWTSEGDARLYHKGFYIAANRVLQEKVEGKDGPVQFLKYIEDHSTYSDGHPIVFVTGHSRGGAMANIVGEYLENRYKDDQGNRKCTPFTYTFASPAVWGDNSRPQTSGVFNVINTDDLVTMVPFSGWGFTRFGEEAVAASVYDRYKKEYEENPEGKIYDYIRNAGSMFANLGCENRKTIYDLTALYKGSEDNYLSGELSETYETKEKADEALPALQKDYENILGDYCKFFELKTVECESILGKYYAIKAKTCVGSLTAVIQRLMGGDEEFIGNIGTWLPILLNPAFKELVLYELLPNIIAGGSDVVALPHDYGAYHIILREYGKQ